jgi:hypothetical protein
MYHADAQSRPGGKQVVRGLMFRVFFNLFATPSKNVLYHTGLFRTCNEDAIKHLLSRGVDHDQSTERR